MANVFYNDYRGELAKGNIDFANDTFKVMFVDPSYSPNVDNETYLSDISANRAANTTDQTLASVTVTVDDTNDQAVIDANNISYDPVTTDTDAIVIYKDTGVDSTSVLICFIDFNEGTASPIAGELAITFDSDGIITL